MSGDHGGGASAVVDVEASSAEVFHLLADIEQWPRWAPRLFYGLGVGRDGWSAYSPWGELKLELESDAVARSLHLEVREGRVVRGVVSVAVEAADGGGARVRLRLFLERGDREANEVMHALYACLQGELRGLGRALAERWMEPGARVGPVRDAA